MSAPSVYFTTVKVNFQFQFKNSCSAIKILSSELPLSKFVGLEYLDKYFQSITKLLSAKKNLMLNYLELSSILINANKSMFISIIPNFRASFNPLCISNPDVAH